jgi:hypothetical protein
MEAGEDYLSVVVAGGGYTGRPSLGERLDALDDDDESDPADE